MTDRYKFISIHPWRIPSETGEPYETKTFGRRFHKFYGVTRIIEDKLIEGLFARVNFTAETQSPQRNSWGFFLRSSRLCGKKLLPHLARHTRPDMSHGDACSSSSLRG